MSTSRSSPTTTTTATRNVFLGRFTEPNLLFRNDDGQFTDVTEGAGLGHRMVTVATAGDYDADGDLDLYLGRYLDPRTELPTTLFYTRNSEGNSLLRNDGELRFTEVTEEAGVRGGWSDPWRELRRLRPGRRSGSVRGE